MRFSLSKAVTGDVKPIHACLLSAAADGLLLPRSLSQIYSHVRDFYVARDEDGGFAGCCALSIVWDDLAEIRSLYVKDEFRGSGLGRVLVNTCIDEGKTMGIRRVFTLTYVTDFFGRMNFKEVPKDILPQKIWSDCINCPKFPDCDEIAMLIEV